ncbi:MAG: hypothetical protein WC878_00265 [Candidatus Paceibacterota bacterium]
MEIEREVKSEKILINATGINITKNIIRKFQDPESPIFSAWHFRHTQKETL